MDCAPTFEVTGSPGYGTGPSYTVWVVALNFAQATRIAIPALSKKYPAEENWRIASIHDNEKSIYYIDDDSEDDNG